jgi:ketosteroid isomerase-like protein
MGWCRHESSRPVELMGRTNVSLVHHGGNAMARLADPTPDQIIALEKSYWDAMKTKDGNATAALSGDISLVTGAKGVMSIAKARMGKMTEDGNWQLESYAFDNVQVVIPAPDVAIIAYTVRQKVVMDGKTANLHAADSSTWLRGENGWQCHAHSETFLEDSSR